MNQSWPGLGATALPLLGIALVSCVESQTPDPQAVSPARVYHAENTPITITGEYFHPVVTVDVGRDGNSVDDSFGAEFVHTVSGESIELEGLFWESFQELRGVWPEDQATGTYDLYLTSPEGGDPVVLQDALTVSDSRANTIVVTPQVSSEVVGEFIQFDISLVDAQGNAVVEAGSVPVSLEISGPDASSLSFPSTQGIDELTQTGDENSWVGRLSFTEENWFTVSSSVDGLLTLTVSDDGEGLEDGRGTVLFEPGNLDDLEIILPSSNFTATAGESFPVTFRAMDDEGNLVDGPLQLEFSDSCSGVVEPSELTLNGEETVLLTFGRANSGACSQTQLLVDAQITWTSDPFTVRPADASELVVRFNGLAGLSGIQAGEGVELSIQAIDPYNNVVVDYDESLSFTVRGSSGELEGADVVSRLSEVWNNGLSYWVWTPTSAGENVLEASGGGLTALAPSLGVVAGPAVDLDANVQVSSVVAGETFDLSVALSDAYANSVSWDGSTYTLSVDDGAGSVGCSFQSMTEVAAEFECAATHATSGVSLTVEVDPGGLTAQTDVIEVTNAAADSATWSLPASAVAGDSFAASLQVYDAFGNPYRTGTRGVTLSDDSGTLSPSSASLKSDGSLSLNLSITEAGTRAVTVSMGGDLGTDTIEILADDAASLELDLQEPWAWQGDSVPLEVQAVDQFGNLVQDYSRTVTVSSQASGFSDLSLSGFSGGLATTTLSWDQTALQDRVLVQDDQGLSGTSSAIDVVEVCADGPTSLVLIGGSSDEAVSCRSGGLASVNVDLSTSSPGSASLIAMHLDDGEGNRLRAAVGSQTLSASEPGVTYVQALVVDSDACADLDSGVWYVADSGDIAGPISLSLAHSGRVAGGSSTVSDTTLSVSAQDCTGASLSSGQVYLRTDMGAFSGLSTDSQGQYLDLSMGSTVTWSGTTAIANGTANVYAGALDNSAWGSASLTLSSESEPPVVCAVDPRGSSSEMLDSVEILLSEDLDETSISGAVSLTGPDGSVGFTASVQDETLTLALDEQVDASDGTFTLTLTSALTDSEGNALDGDWSGGSSSFSTSFGAVSSLGLQVSACTLSTSVLTPDGNAGTADEADSVSISASATGTPDYWVLEVYDSSGARVYTEYTAATSSSQTLSWDARDHDGRIQSPGGYLLGVSALDSSDTLSDSCTQSLTLQQHFVEPG